MFGHEKSNIPAPSPQIVCEFGHYDWITSQTFTQKSVLIRYCMSGWIPSKGTRLHLRHCLCRSRNNEKSVRKAFLVYVVNKWDVGSRRNEQPKYGAAYKVCSFLNQRPWKSEITPSEATPCRTEDMEHVAGTDSKALWSNHSWLK
jgi:hypothetical protein